MTLYILNNKFDTSYSDGYAEVQLLKIFSSENPEKQRNKILAGSPSWPLLYHLSPRRGTIVRWYQFEHGANVLEIGAGCGAITEVLIQKDINITALELTEKRSLINARRNKHAKNLEIIIGNIENYSPTKKFDYVVCIGVLEYAGSFVEGNNPYDKFLSKIKSLLKDNGKLLLAIENKMGLKYFAGSREDHTGMYFDGINDYPSQKRVRTFGRIELEKLITKSGFSSTNFYYPFPDYKLPTVIFSDDYLPGVHCDFPLNLLPVDAPDHSREHLFSEQLAMLSLESNLLYSHFANSFLVEAS